MKLKVPLYAGVAVVVAVLALDAAMADRLFGKVMSRLVLWKWRLCMYFFVTTENPRPTFNLDMTPEERDTMKRHVAYWSEWAARGIAIVFGPVMDPQGVFGMGVYKVRDEAESSMSKASQEPR